MLGKIGRAVRAVLGRERVESDLERELRFHIEQETDEYVRRGMPREDARRAALHSFGGVDAVKEECRDAWGVRLLETIGQDVRYGLRLLVRSPGFSLVSILILGLGIGANTAIFSVVYGVLLRPLPYEHGDRIVVLRQEAPLARVNSLGFSHHEIADYRAQTRSFDSLVEYHSMSFILLGRDEAERVQTAVVSWDFFEVFGVRPLLGRTFLEEDERHGADAVLVLSHEYWLRSHRGDPGIVGRRFRMNDRVHTVVGVLPPIPQYPSENDVYMPTTACPFRASEATRNSRTARMMSLFGRVKPGTPVAQTRADVASVAARLEAQYPEAYPQSRGFGAKAASLAEELTRTAKPRLLMLAVTAVMVLFIACANVANLMLARLVQREREVAVRAALGASRGRIVRQLLTEGMILSLAGGLLGIGLAALCMRLLVAFTARFTTRAGEVGLDGSALAITLAVSVATGLLFGLAPAFALSRNFNSALKEAGARLTSALSRQRLRSGLVVLQVAVSFVVLIGAGLMARSFVKLEAVHPGFDPERVLAVRLSLNWSKYRNPEQSLDFHLRLLANVQRRPGVVSAAVSSIYPLSPIGITFGPFLRGFEIEGRPVAQGELPPQGDSRVSTPGYFETIRVPLARGRFFTEEDDEDALRVAIINQSTARHRFGGDDPVGRRITLDRGRTWITIVGVVGDIRQYGLNSEPSDEIYRPLRQVPGAGGNLLVRTSSDPAAMTADLRRAVREIDPETAIADVSTLVQVRDESLRSPRLTTVLMALFAALALVITVSGISGVAALAVSQRTHEIGVRVALGATPASIARMVLGQGIALTGAGLALGIAGAIGLTRLLTTFLFGIEPTDPATFAAAGLVFAAATAVACLAPARRATSVDPLLALKSE